MAMRHVQQFPAKGRGVAVLWLVGHHLDPALRVALPDWGIVASDAAPLTVTPGDLRIEKLVGAPSGVGLLLVGFSAGCQSVRSAIMGDALGAHDLLGVAVFDGTHSSWPINVAHVEVWRRLMADARAGTIGMVATATSMGYTERIPAGQPGRAASTRHVLEAALGATLTVGAPVREGRLHVELFASGDIDKAAHIAQQRDVMPRLLAACFGGAAVADTDPAGWTEAAAAAALDALRPTAAAVRATVARLLDEQGGHVLPPGAGSQPGGHVLVELAPHGWRCSVAELYRDAVALGTWRPAGSGYVPQLGDLVISGRAGGDPTRGGTGHVERVSRIEPGEVWTIGGNEANTWMEAPLRVLPLGWIEYPRGLALRALAATRAEMLAGVREVPGPLAHPRIQAYHAGARRGGSPRAGMPGHEREGVSVLGARASDEHPWCASAASSCCHEAAAG